LSFFFIFLYLHFYCTLVWEMRNAAGHGGKQFEKILSSFSESFLYTHFMYGPCKSTDVSLLLLLWKHRRIRCLLLAVFSEKEHFLLWSLHLVSQPVACFCKYADDKSNSLPLYSFNLRISVSIFHTGRLNWSGAKTAGIKLLIYSVQQLSRSG